MCYHFVNVSAIAVLASVDAAVAAASTPVAAPASSALNAALCISAIAAVAVLSNPVFDALRRGSPQALVFSVKRLTTDPSAMKVWVIATMWTNVDRLECHGDLIVCRVLFWQESQIDRPRLGEAHAK